MRREIGADPVDQRALVGVEACGVAGLAACRRGCCRRGTAAARRRPLLGGCVRAGASRPAAARRRWRRRRRPLAAAAPAAAAGPVAPSAPRRPRPVRASNAVDMNAVWPLPAMCLSACACALSIPLAAACGDIAAPIRELPINRQRRFLNTAQSFSPPTRISRLPAWLGWPTTPSCSIRSISEAARL